MERRNAARRRRPDRGMTLVEIAVFVLVATPLVIALASTVGVFTSSAEAQHDRTAVNAQNHKILQKIVGELTQTSTQIDHPVAGAAARPQPETFAAGTANEAYDRDVAGGAHDVDTLHEVAERDGFDAWHSEDASRRFYIYGTFEPFDTIEYQKVLMPADLSNVDPTAQTVEQPWSPRRKILLLDGDVVLRAEDGSGGTRSLVLGKDVEDLTFHLNADGQIIIRLTTTSGAARLTTQVTVQPRNGLSQL